MRSCEIMTENYQFGYGHNGCCNSYIQAHDLQIWAYENYICERHFRCSTLVVQRPMKSLSSVCPSVRPSLSLLKIGSLIFSDIACDDS